MKTMQFVARKVIFLATLFVAAIGQAPAADAPCELKIGRYEEGIRYAPATLLDLTLDVLLPANRHSDVLVLMIHGGGWDKGDKDAFRAEMIYFSCRGWDTATLDYRLSDQAIFPAPWEDVWSAIRFLGREHHHIVLMGHSAGGHLAALAALRRPQDLSPQEESLVVGAIGIAGVYDLTYDMQRKTNWPFRKVLEKTLGGSYDTREVQQRAVEASPVTYLKTGVAPPHTPRFLLIQGKQDAGVPVLQAIEFDAALKAANVPVETCIIPNAGHYVFYDQREKTLAVIENFLREIDASLADTEKNSADSGS